MVQTLNIGAQLHAAPRLRKGPPCTVSVILDQLDSDDRDALQTALNDRLVGTATIFRVLTGNGFQVGLNAVQRHRRGECACEHR